MHKATATAICILALAGVYGLAQAGGPNVASPRVAAVAKPAVATAATLEFQELVVNGPVLETSAKARALAGRRVRIVGFMAQMEVPPTGAFYLTPRPTRCDEAGGGTADLPPESVLVGVKSAADQQVPFVDGAIEVTGVLDVGNSTDAQGRVSAFRIALDAPAHIELSTATNNVTVK
jgi:hypothetical protein